MEGTAPTPPLFSAPGTHPCLLCGLQPSPALSESPVLGELGPLPQGWIPATLATLEVPFSFHGCGVAAPPGFLWAPCQAWHHDTWHCPPHAFRLAQASLAGLRMFGAQPDVTASDTDPQGRHAPCLCPAYLTGLPNPARQSSFLLWHIPPSSHSATSPSAVTHSRYLCPSPGCNRDPKVAWPHPMPVPRVDKIPAVS